MIIFDFRYKGYQGDPSPRDCYGAKGQKGDQGIYYAERANPIVVQRGPKGPFGYPGYKGEQGNQGARGTPGRDGRVGQKGLKGKSSKMHASFELL